LTPLSPGDAKAICRSGRENSKLSFVFGNFPRLAFATKISGFLIAEEFRAASIPTVIATEGANKAVIWSPRQFTEVAMPSTDHQSCS